MEEGKHAYSGSYEPGSRFHHLVDTFSVGIFQWIPKSGWKCCKKSAVKVRVRGYVSNPEAVYAKAKEIVSQLDAGTYSGPRNVTVK